jgi:hypothetical protein
VLPVDPVLPPPIDPPLMVPATCKLPKTCASPPTQS